MKTRSLLIACLCLSALTSPLCAQNRALYRITTENILAETHYQIWEVAAREDIRKSTGNDFAYQVTKKYTSPGKNALPATTELETPWQRTAETQGEAYLVQSFVRHPAILSPNESSFGHIEIRTAKEGEVVERWPLFFWAEQSAVLKWLTFIAYMPKNEKLVIREAFREDQYHLPIEKEISYYKGDGTLRSKTLYKRITF